MSIDSWGQAMFNRQEEAYPLQGHTRSRQPTHVNDWLYRTFSVAGTSAGCFAHDSRFNRRWVEAINRMMA